MINEGSCNWGATISKGTSKNFSFKFVIANGNSAVRWESDPNRQFNGAALQKLAESSSSGKYQNCEYIKKGNVINLSCIWR